MSVTGDERASVAREIGSGGGVASIVLILAVSSVAGGSIARREKGIRETRITRTEHQIATTILVVRD